MNWAISNLTGGNRVSRAILVRYSSVPLADAGDGSSTGPQTPTASTPRASASHTSLSSTFAATFLHSSSRHVPGRAVPRHNANGNGGKANSNAPAGAAGAAGGAGGAGPATQLSLPMDVEETVTCFCRKARRKERDGDQNSTDTKLYLEESVLERKLPEADLKALVDLPAGLDYNEWLASHTLALFEHVNLVYGTISEFCTQSGCADMTGPGNRTYLWFDEKGKKTRVAAPQYIDYVMTFTQKTVSDESIFPTKYANEFPGSFESIARKILRLQFHVIAHLYAAHFREIALLGLHTHLNLTFAHLTALHRRFNLIDEKETDVLRDLEVALRLTDDSGGQDTSSSSVHEHSSSSSSPPVVAAAASAGCDQPQHNNSSSTSNSTSSAEALHVNSQSNSNSNSHTTNASASASLIDGDAAAPPICTQPEAGAGCKPAGSSGLLGGILGDLTSGEFGDTTRYCTSAVPQAATSEDGAVSSAALNNGAGALHLNFSNNNNNNHNLNHHLHHHHHHQHHHQHHHGHHGHGHHQAPASGLIQCNAVGAGGGNVAAAVAAASGGQGAATSAASSTA
ncbi:MOB kinase activator-like 2 isoform X1 [Drosophila guanche]|uniref:MOB kinase activator-like 2 n=1 Tax=Drosophila guanche TaxID=7266 RepID=A0A3B0JNI5_DROGU|nr:MOB kinase activator-like 2 isoform X1 [Drosophila guanche]SPP77080.1 blast:MOB kinase activator-like 2 [Drosophila guanche]